jgi:magnesium transporter
MTRTIIFDPQGHLVKEMGPSAVEHSLKAEGYLLWMDVQDPTAEELELIQQEFHLHPLAIEDVVKGRQRPKLDSYEDHFYLVCYALTRGERLAQCEPCQLNVFVGANYIVTIHAGAVGILSETLARWEQGVSHREAGAGFLLYFILDAVVDDYFPMLDEIDDRIEALERSLFVSFQEEALQEIFQLKRSLVTMRRVIAPLRDVMHQFVRQEPLLLSPGIQVYFQDVHDHVIRVVESLDTHREILTGTLEAYLGALSSRLNQVIKKLTVLATVVGGVGVILAAWGMNVKHLPLHDDPRAFSLVLGGAVVASVAGLVTAWKARWL